jgi:hypothetical protein
MKAPTENIETPEALSKVENLKEWLTVIFSLLEKSKKPEFISAQTCIQVIIQRDDNNLKAKEGIILMAHWETVFSMWKEAKNSVKKQVA